MQENSKTIKEDLMEKLEENSRTLKEMLEEKVNTVKDELIENSRTTKEELNHRIDEVFQKCEELQKNSIRLDTSEITKGVDADQAVEVLAGESKKYLPQNPFA
ncbi:hypothetical protein FQA39_LY16620 [Lamprigera yunnana]|nr:hypothetical protein FQA39_LY16620 [Lamprigera yunnana]